ncbi:hypothetical protein [Paraburkholderia sp. A1RO-5L]|uniref:hypothetical protein n=1 Tax=Paraburkholderia sp. A1RO-5L TaxID=3028370 RepID=UPI003B7E2927
MRHEDTLEFTKSLQLCCKTLNKPMPEPDSMKFWLKLLEPYALEDVKAALLQHMRSGTTFAPVPRDVISYIDKTIDCWVSPDEAWAIASKSYAKPGELEVNTVVTCNEIDQALDHVRHLLDAGDRFNASRAFKDVYTRIVDVERQKHAKPRWRISKGSDVSQHERVIGGAVREGRIALEDGRAAYPLLAGPGDDRPIDPKTAAENRSKVAGLLAILAKPRPAAKAPDMAPDIAASREEAAEQVRKANEYAAAQQREKAEAEAYRMIASLAHLSDGEIATYVRLIAEHVEVA